MSCRWIVASLILWAPLLVATPSSAAELPVPLDLATLSKVPETFTVESTVTEKITADGVRSLFFAGPVYQGKPTRVFAWVGLPAKASAEHKVPGMVLIHGGGGTAFDRWVKVWTARGYAAIAMDTCGCVPVGTYGNWKRHEHGGPPGWDASFGQLDQPVTDQWPWHAVSSAVLSHSLLRSLPEVDSERIGVTGISWGGYLTSLVSGVDSRFQFACPVYGCGFLGDNSAWLPAFEKLGKERALLWLSQWDPAGYLPSMRRPMLWVNGTNDFAYPMDSWQKSYRLPTGQRTLALRIRMPHGHGPVGENPEEIHQFANQILRGETPLAVVTGQGITPATEAAPAGELWATFQTSRPVKSAELCFTRDRGKWTDRKWESLPATIDAELKDDAPGKSSSAVKTTRRVHAAIPAEATVVYLNLFDETDCAVSSEHVVR